MTVPVDSCRSTYVTDGVVDDFPTVWRFLANGHVHAWHTPTGDVASLLVEGVHYDLVGAGLDGGGTLTTIGTPLAAGTLVLEREVPLTQLVDLRQQGTFSPTVHMGIVDQMAMGLQQLAARIAALEAEASLTSLAVFDSQVVEFELLTDAGDVEDSFPFNVAVVAPEGSIVTGVVITAVGGAVGGALEPITMPFWTWAGDVLSVGHITGLEPGRNYVFRILCTHQEP